MNAVNRYRVMINGKPRVMNLSAVDAKKYDHATLLNEVHDEGDEAHAAVKSRAASRNKARSATNKSRAAGDTDKK